MDVADLEACAALESAAEKLACYEALTATPAAKASVPEAPRARDAAVSPRAAAAPARCPVAEVPAVAPAPAAESQPAAESEGAAAAAPAAIPASLGAEQIDRPDEEPTGPVRATVVDVTRAYSGRLEFHFANGHVWRQIEPRRVQYPRSRDFEVVITQGLMGEYRLRVDGDGPLVRIRRIK